MKNARLQINCLFQNVLKLLMPAKYSSDLVFQLLPYQNVPVPDDSLVATKIYFSFFS